MTTNQYPPRKVAPLQYLFRQLNADSGKVVRGWGTAPLMGGLMLLFLIFLLIILQIANASVLLEGIDVNWTVLQDYTSAAKELSLKGTTFASTGVGIFLGLLAFCLCCGALILYGFLSYPVDQE